MENKVSATTKRVVTWFNKLTKAEKSFLVLTTGALLSLLLVSPQIVPTVQSIKAEITSPITRQKQATSFTKECTQITVANNYWDSDIDKLVGECENFQGKMEDILSGLGGKDVNITAIPTGDDSCPEVAIACAYLGQDQIYVFGNFYFNPETKPGEDSPFTIERVIAHEYVHSLTSLKEKDELEENYTEALANPDNIGPIEVVADCGVWYWLEHTDSTAYLTEGCTQEMKDIAKMVIEDTLI